MNLFTIFGTIALRGADNVNRQLGKTTSKAKSSSGGMVAAFKKIGAAVATYFAVDKIVSFGKACVDAAASIAAEEAAFAQIMGDYSDEAQAKIDEIADATGIANTRMTPYMTSMTAKFKGLGYGVEDATDLAARGLTLAADASAFWDKSMDESMGALNSFINGSYEAGESIGLFANDTQMAAYAIEQGLVSSTAEWQKLDEATKQATRLEYAENMMEMSGATGQAAKEADAYANVQANLAEAWRQFQATIGEPILNNIVLPAMQKLNEILPIAGEYVSALIEWVGSAWTKFQEWGTFISETFSPVFDALVVLWDTVKTKIEELFQPITDWVTSGQAATDATNFLKDAIATLAGGLESVITWITDFVNWLGSGSAGAEVFKAVIIGITAAIAAYQTATGLATIATNAATVATNLAAVAQGALNAVMNANPIMIVVTLLAGLVAAFIYLWNNCEGFRQFWIDLWDTICSWCSEKIDAIKEWFSGLKDKWAEVKDSIAENVDDLKQKWEDFKSGIGDKIEAVKEWFGQLGDKWQDIKEKIVTACEPITSAFDGIGDKIESVKEWFGDLKDGITDKIESARDTVSGAIDAIKGFFDFEFKWPSIPLPHFSISPKGWSISDLFSGSIPSLGIEWYAKAMDNAMILDKPSIFGYNAATGELMGGGEKGSEVVSGTDTLLQLISSAVGNRIAEQNERLVSVLMAVLNAITGGNEDIVEALRAGQTIAVDGRVFGRTVREYAR